MTTMLTPTFKSHLQTSTTADSTPSNSPHRGRERRRSSLVFARAQIPSGSHRGRSQPFTPSPKPSVSPRPKTRSPALRMSKKLVDEKRLEDGPRRYERKEMKEERKRSQSPSRSRSLGDRDERGSPKPRRRQRTRSRSRDHNVKIGRVNDNDFGK